MPLTEMAKTGGGPDLMGKKRQHSSTFGHVKLEMPIRNPNGNVIKATSYQVHSIKER